MEQPDSFVIIKIQTEHDIIYRLFSCWYGGYLDGDRWRLNSGITKIEKDGEHFIVYGNSSTVYKIHPDQYNKLTSYCSNVLNEAINSQQNVKCEIINIEQYINANSY